MNKATRNTVVICVVLCAGTILGFWGVGTAGFVNFDDPSYVSKNPTVQGGLTVANIKWAFTTFFYNNWHPLTWLSYMTDCELFGLSTRAFHLVNLGLHVANTLLLFLLLRRLTGALWASAVVAAFFGWHPLHVESVAWIAERKDVLSTLFWLLATWAYASYAKSRSAGWYVGMCVLFALGLMAKSMLVTLPFVLLLLDIWPLQRLDLHRPKWLTDLRRLALEKLPLFALAAATSYATYVAQGEAVRTMEDIGLSHRIANAFLSYARYIAKTFWPTDLSVFYPYPPQGWPVWEAVPAAAIVLLTSACAFVTIRKRPYLFVGWFWFIGTLVPVIGLVQIGSQSIADRYMYVPSIGLFIAVVWSVREWIPKERFPTSVMGSLTCVALIACLVVTRRQVEHWQNSITLFTHAERHVPPNILVLNNLIGSFLEVGRTNEAKLRVQTAMKVAPHEGATWWQAGNIAAAEGALDQAVEYYQRGLRVKPNHPELNFNVGLIFHKQGKFKDAVPYYSLAISNKPAYWEAELNLAYALVALGDAPSAILHYLSLLRLRPDFAAGHYDLATVYLETGQVEEALRHLREAVRLKPDYGNAHRELGVTLAKQGDQSEAQAHLEQALKLNPDDATAHLALAGVWTQASKIERAIAEYRETLRLAPEAVAALNNLAWLRATYPEAKFRDGNEAVALAERACELTDRKNPFFLGTLAAAYAEAGVFEKAVATADKAIDLAESQNQKQVAEKNRELLRLYRSNKPFRDPGP